MDVTLIPGKSITHTYDYIQKRYIIQGALQYHRPVVTRVNKARFLQHGFAISREIFHSRGGSISRFPHSLTAMMQEPLTRLSIPSHPIPLSNHPVPVCPKTPHTPS